MVWVHWLFIWRHVFYMTLSHVLTHLVVCQRAFVCVSLPHGVDLLNHVLVNYPFWSTFFGLSFLKKGIVIVFLATGPWLIPKLWGGDVPNLERDPSGPRFRCLCKYVSLTCSALFCPPLDVRLRGISAHAPSLSPLPSIVFSYRIIHQSELHLYPSQNTEAHLYLHQTPLPPYLYRPHRACQIHNSMPLPPLTSHLTLHWAVSKLPFYTTTVHGASPLPCSLSPCCKSPV